MTREGPYHYDPTNFHGPLHFYFLFVMQTLFGRHIWALRLPTALFSTLCVGVALGYRRYLGRTTCRLAALGIAISPAMTFYGRYAIHESFLLLSLMVTVWGLIGLWRDGTRERALGDGARHRGDDSDQGNLRHPSRGAGARGADALPAGELSPSPRSRASRRGGRSTT